MSNREFYHVADDQRAGKGYAVSPLWPLLALMLSGAWLAWAWFVFNARALNSPTFTREAVWAVGGLLGSVVLAIAILAWAAGAADDAAMTVRIRYALIGLSVWKLACGYRVYLLQSRTVELYEFYGGTLRNALPVVFAGFFVRAAVIGFVDVPFLRLALS